MVLPFKWSVVIFILVALAGCSKPYLYSGLSDYEADEMLNLLLERNVDVHKSQQSDKFSIHVAEDDKVVAIDILAKHHLPRTSRETCTALYKFNDDKSYRYNLQMGVENMLEHLVDVATARVQLVLPYTGSSDVIPKNASAAVLLKTYRHIKPGARSDIRKLVADAIPGLEFPNVTLVIKRSTG